jgi:hypothetical protein
MSGSCGFLPRRPRLFFCEERVAATVRLLNCDVASIMAIARTAAELRRWNDLAVIRRALMAAMPELADKPVGLAEVADLCKRRAASRPGLDLHEMRDLILTIACEWDLACDRLDEQSNTCLSCVAQLLR